jgi:ABC-type multidrug transport system permease subunit
VPPDPLQDGLAWVLLALSAIAIVLFVLLARLRRRGGKAN